MRNKYLITVTTSKFKHSVIIDKAISPLDALLQAIYSRNIDIYDDIINIIIVKGIATTDFNALKLKTAIFEQKQIDLLKEIIEE